MDDSILEKSLTANNEYKSNNSRPESSNIASGLACLVMIAKVHGIAVNPEQLEHEFSPGAQVFGTEEILLAARKIGLYAEVHKIEPQKMSPRILPAMGIRRDANGVEEFFVLGKINNDHALLQTANGRLEKLSLTQLEQTWHGDVILFRLQTSYTQQTTTQFDFTWFIPAIVKYRKLLLEVLAVSFVLQFFALITPLFFQVIMDKVLVHRAFNTLNVICVGLTIIIIFEVTITSLRSYLFSHTTCRIDVELGVKLFEHLLALPISYFQNRRVGDSVARVRELENIRSFLTGNSVTLVLDLIFSMVFIGIMFIYSGWLTLIVLLSLPCYILLSLVFTPLLRHSLKEKFNRGAENQAFLVETISGIDTIKAMSVEPHWKRKWNDQLAGYIASGFRTSTLSNLANNGVNLISKLVSVITMFVGARLVMDAQLTLGQLIAFNMLASQVAQPVMRLAQLWTEFQQVGISMQRLGDILDTKAEFMHNKMTLPKIQGRIHFDEVSFRYRPDGREVLKKITLDIQVGEIIGIVGRSGSGKSTLTKLIQRLYIPEQGRITIDGFDLALTDVSSLRRQMGVVLQENVLFNTSVHNNIALTDPGASLEKVMHAAKLAGAHEFILELPEAYETMVGEHGSSLSGGQRQRIAIARALMTNPRILIFDEATSALDYESEAIIQANMQAICKGRTVIIIAHRLLAVRDAHRILVMEQGQIVETGSHAELVKRPNGHYAHLYHLQQR